MRPYIFIFREKAFYMPTHNERTSKHFKLISMLEEHRCKDKENILILLGQMKMIEGIIWRYRKFSWYSSAEQQEKRGGREKETHRRHPLYTSHSDL